MQTNFHQSLAFASAPRGAAPHRSARSKGPHFFSTDLSLRKRWALPRSLRPGVRADVFNVFNRVNRGNPNTNLSSGAFGQIDSAGPARQVQFGLRLEF